MRKGLHVLIGIALATAVVLAATSNDDFSGVAQPDLVNASDGGTWTRVSSNFLATDGGGRVTPTAGADFAWYYYNRSWTVDHYSQATLASYNVGYYAQVCVRMQVAAISGYCLYADNTGGAMTVAIVTAGAIAGTVATLVSSPSSGQVLYLQVSGAAPPSFVAKINGIADANCNPCTDGGNTYISGKSGLGGYSAAAGIEYDDWSGDDVAGGGGGGTVPRMLLLGVGRNQ